MQLFWPHEISIIHTWWCHYVYNRVRVNLIYNYTSNQFVQLPLLGLSIHANMYWQLLLQTL